ncbi:MAG: esterase/lipase family protein [Woeseiaceae bacterium]
MPAVVLLHGIWMPGAGMWLMKRRLERRHGFATELFDYPSVKGTLDENAELLDGFLRERAATRVHLVGHSLGGVVAMRALAINPDAPVARVVCLGSPLCGSRAARSLGMRDWGHAMMGKTIGAGVVEHPAVEWAVEVTRRFEVGIIAGTRPHGLGRLLTQFDGDSDGTVAVAETRLPGARDHLCLPVSHTGMVLSKGVAGQVAAFLQNGRFLPGPAGD